MHCRAAAAQFAVRFQPLTTSFKFECNLCHRARRHRRSLSLVVVELASEGTSSHDGGPPLELCAQAENFRLAGWTAMELGRKKRERDSSAGELELL